MSRRDSNTAFFMCFLCLFVAGFKKRMGATYVGVRRAHPYSWLLSSPQQPLETEDPPTVSLAPQYTPQRLCRARGFFSSLRDPCVYLLNSDRGSRAAASSAMSRVDFSHVRV